MQQDSAPILIVYGALRSGTTLLRLMLHGHDHMICPGEADFLVDFLRQDSSGQWHLKHQALQDDRIYRASGAVCDPSLPAVAAVRAMAEMMRGDRDKVLVIMLHRHLRRALDVFPDARVVHMLRDPRDVAHSSIGMGWAGTTFHGIDHWIHTEDEWDRTVADGPAFTAMQLRYEELIQQPEHELTRLTTFAGLSYQANMLRYPEWSTYALPDRKLMEQWRRKQSRQEVSLVEGKIGDRLAACGYAPSGFGATSPGKAQKLRLAIVNRSAIWAEKRRRFGLLDPALVGLARRLNMPGLGRKAQRRIDIATIAHLK